LVNKQNTRKHEIFVEHIRDFGQKSMSSLDIRVSSTNY
jgi:hypothetical protein